MYFIDCHLKFPAVNINIKSCDDMTDKSTCKPFLNHLSTNEICTMLKKPLPSYRGLMKSVNPLLICPLQNTTYEVRNFLLPNDLARYMQRSSKRIYYYIHITATRSNREVGCFQFFMFAGPTKKTK